VVRDGEEVNNISCCLEIAPAFQSDAGAIRFRRQDWRAGDELIRAPMED
jgi:hypothetical protein